MNDSPYLLVPDGEKRRRTVTARPPSGVQVLAPILIVAGSLLAITGWLNVGLSYYPLRFGDVQWEFGTIAQTTDAMPLPTVGFTLLALGIRARGDSIAWSRAAAAIFAVVALLCLAALGLFALDIPPTFRAMQGAAANANQPSALISLGLKLGMAKVIIFALCYATGYASLAVTMWRASDRGMPSRGGPSA